MSKVITKLFRDPEVVSQVVKKLQDGSLDKGLSLVSRSDKKSPAVARSKHVKAKIDAYELSIQGALAASVESAGDKAGDALKAGLGVSEEGYDYYINKIVVGGILLRLEVDEAQARKISAIFSDVERNQPVEECSKTFKSSGRMAATNSMDAAMSGDFRKY